MSSKKQMVINYVPGEECRVAIIENGRLEEFHAERMDGPSNHVGNIYVGKVMNVEQSIQAAFIDFGLEQNGFLHTSDVHPQYFGGDDAEKTERVGRKTPRRERPPIQDCFRRGDEVAVQVLKEGVGTKGPTVTSYLSIPGRFLVMMPQMDKVGVSRKVEDEETRRKMREILDQLDLPEGFGFILRTAGMERSKAELKRDLAYLMRLWKDMERRWKTGNKPRLLYSESDLLVRALRDLLTTDIDEIVVDNEAALTRAARFLKIVAPRTSTRLVHYTGKSPVFHVMGIEPQIQMIHAREVPLESGGRLVIDEAEALVAIDVNSGKSREARDSETNAYQTNLEAADEICRQLRLRDLGGVIVNDLIDMRSAKHRRDIEARFAENFKKDRARWTIAPISEFGILEMTRQRMRASHESQHFTDCPMCRGRGLVQRPDSVAADALRELAALLDSQGVHRVELVVHPRIAGELLSTKRRALGRLERTSGKHVDVRVSEAITVDRVTFYAYDERGADLDIPKLGHRRATEQELVTYEITSDAGEEWANEPEPTASQENFSDEPEQLDAEAHPIELEPLSLAEIAAQDRSRSQRPQLGRGQGHGQANGQGSGPHGSHGPQHADGPEGEQGEGGRRRRRRRGRRGRGGAPDQQQQGEFAGDPNYIQPSVQPEDGAAPFNADGTNAPYPNEGEYAPEGGFEGQPQYPGDGQPQDANFNGGPMPSGDPNDPSQTGGRRRRRRRGGRGRGNSNGQPGFAGQPGQPGDADNAPAFDENGQPWGGAPQPGFDGQYAPEGQPNEGEAPFEQPVGESAEYVNPEGQDTGQMPSGEPGFPGQQNFGDEQGEGGPRPRRRRGRRGGSGGGGGGGGGAGGPNAGPVGRSPAPGASNRGRAQDQPSLAAMFRDTTPMPNQPIPANDFAPDAGGEFDQPPMNDDGSGGSRGEPGEGGSNEGGPRRGRRRGRRGGRGRDGAPEGGNDAPPMSEPVAPRAAPAPRSQSTPRNQPVPRNQPAPAPKSAASPKPTAQPKGAPAPVLTPKVRTLYGSRRRIAPTEIKNVKRED